MHEIDAVLVVGARPQFIKTAPVIKEILSNHKHICLRLIHSGQHYDPKMSDIFFHELEIPPETINLRVGSGSHATQTANIMTRLERALLEKKPDLVIVPGDTNTTLGGCVTAAKLGIPVAHIEAGLRSGDMSMPEEINRIVTDHCSTLLFAPTKTAVRNLRKENLARTTHLTGDTMVDALKSVMPIVTREEHAVLNRFGLRSRQYVMVTLHRPSNVDDPNRLSAIYLSLCKVTKLFKVVFPVHPRTRVRLTRLSAYKRAVKSEPLVIDPQGYVESLSLMNNASCLITDSGGMQKEAFLLRVPCITFRNTTEWPETFTGSANRLLDRPERIFRTVQLIASDEVLRRRIGALKNPFGDGHASEKIARIIENTFRSAD